MTTQVKLSSFYGPTVARPYLLLGEDKRTIIKDRVDTPSVNSALLEWASKATFEAGGVVVKPTDLETTKIVRARNEFQIFCSTQRADIFAANPNLMEEADERAFKIAASLFWKERLTDDERNRYKEQAAAERDAVKQKEAQRTATDPEYATYKLQELRYKIAKGAQLSAARTASEPLWRVQRKMNRDLSSKAANNDKENRKNGGAGKKKRKTRKRIKLPERLRVVVKKRPTKHIEVRSKAMAAQRAATKAQKAAERAERAAAKAEGERRKLQETEMSQETEEGEGEEEIAKIEDAPIARRTRNGGYTGEFELPADDDKPKLDQKARRRSVNRKQAKPTRNSGK